MSIDDIIALYADYHWPDELRMMSRLASQVEEGCIVAIGSYRGQMDCALALDAKVPVYAVDPRYQNGTHYGDVDRPYWMRNVLDMGLAEKIRPINLSSVYASKAFPWLIGLLFVDGNHDKVDIDLELWLPHVCEGGLIAMHDINFDSVRAAIAHRPELVGIEHANVTAVYKRKGL